MPIPRHFLAALLLIPFTTVTTEPLPATTAPREPLEDRPVALEEPRTIEDFRFEGLRALDGATVLHHLGLAVGMVVDATILDRALRDLWATKLVDDVDLTLEPGGAEGAVVVVTIEERPRISALRYEGLDRLTRSRVSRWVAEANLEPDLGAAVDLPALERLQSEIAAFLAAEDRPRAVSYRLEPQEPGSVAVVFSFTAPEHSGLLVEIAFEGVQAVPGSKLRKAMKRNKEARLGVRLTGRGRLDRAGLEEDLDSVRRVYRDRGFKDVLVGEPRIEALDPTSERLRLTIPVEEGLGWSLGGLSVSGNRVFSDQKLLALFERQGNLLSQSAVDRWTEAIRGRYEAEGRIDTRIEIELRERPGGRVELRARVEEAAAVALGRLEIVGNSRTSGLVLREELGVDEGQTLDLGTLRRGLGGIEARGLLTFAGEPLRLERPVTRPGEIDLTLTGLEADPFRIDFGGGWSRSDGLSGHLTFEARNLLGTGSSAGLRFAEGDIRDQLELFFTQPRLFGRRQTLSAELFDRGNLYSLPRDQRFSRQERGSRISWSRAIGRQQATRLSLTRSSFEDSQSVVDDPARRRETSLDRYSLEWTWSFDSRDDLLQPRRGLSARTSLATSSGDQELLETRASLSAFWPLGDRGVLATRLEGGVIDTRGGPALSPLDAYFLGGPRSIRGFASGSIVALSSLDQVLIDEAGFVLGGSRYLEAGLEYRFQLTGPFGAALFLDAGDVWADGQSVDLDGLRTSAGAELWLRLPQLGVPLRLVWAHNLEPLPGDDFDSLLLSFGTSF